MGDDDVDEAPAAVVHAASAVAAARAIAPEAAALAAQTERERALPDGLRARLLDAGLFHLCLPRSLGGREVEPAEFVLALEELARGDGSPAWCAMVASTSCLLGAFIPPEQAAVVYSGARGIPAGVFAPRGRAVRSPAGFAVSGRWPFMSGVGHCDWLMGGCVVSSATGEPELLDPPSAGDGGGGPDIRLMLMPRERVQVIDTWSVSGLCGTGSHDVEAHDVEVPEALGVSLFTDRPREQGRLYAFPMFGLLALGISAVALGIARGAIDELVELAGAKRPVGGARSLAERPAIQAEVARARAKLDAARAYVLDRARNAWDLALPGEPLDVEHRLGLRLAATHATWAAAEATAAMYHTGGGSSIYSDSPLQRRFRDVHVATQHIMVAPGTWELTGRLLLGVPTDATQL